MTTGLMTYQKEVLDQWGRLTSTAFDSLREVSDLNAKLMEKLSEQQREIIRSCVEASAREATLMSGSKDYSELLTAQAALAAEYNQRFRSIVSRTTEILDECREELAAWVRKRADTAPSPAAAPRAKPRRQRPGSGARRRSPRRAH